MEEMNVEALAHPPAVHSDAGPVETHATVGTAHGDPHADDGHGGHGGNPVDLPMFLWFLAVFGIAAYILKTKAFGPILASLDAREQKLAEADARAEQIAERHAGLEAAVQEKLDQADADARRKIDAARDAAREAARHIEHEAREKAQILRENASRDIESQRQVAEASLREQSAATAVALAMRLLNERLDEPGKQALTDRLIAEM